MLRIRTTNGPAVSTARLWAEIDLCAVRHNVATLRSRLRPGCALIAVVKADGYGHGAVAVARAALDAGAAALAVADAQEGARLRQAGIDARILIVGPSRVADVALIVRHRLEPSIADVELARALDARASGPFDVQIEIDTGMARHGVAAGAAADFVRSLRACPRLRIAGVYTHFAGVDAKAQPALLLQLLLFRGVLQQIGAERPPAHACNTLAACLLPEAHFDAVRIGGGLYGFDPGVPGLDLRPALTLKTTIVALRSADAGIAVGYAGTHVCARPTTLALLPCGYADGLPRANWNDGDVLVRGRRVKIVGHVSMNQTVLDVGALRDVAVGDEVVLLGAQGHERVTAEERVLAGGSAYEITSLLRADLPRIHRDTTAQPARDVAIAEPETP